MRLPIGWAGFISIVLFGTLALFALSVIVPAYPPSLGLLVFGILFLTALAIAKIVGVYVNCPECGAKAGAAVTYGYHPKHGRNSSQLAPKLRCDECGLLVRVSDLPPRFELD